ncbi:Uncharacterised protein (plasmid) [Tsukamurella tyrosinosolvens]|uniref:DUF4345 domain-containing protein n=1 Tax=Tsukamurella tyrosinosolvens TaxID=57704 RepID=A0A1H4XKT6_TSUTY|nr:DUF4345 domain-containing protein [Tsukamurella tyrosinosolvens]AUN41128.1 hypothetical protein ASU32_14845 [Tsukamurella tyrosinosolvens]KXO99883.1 hypothetical protein AXK58_01360 [Tsukamurella tyrosinosolvens]MEC4615080.1 DUF4345 domain-containing protein [Tsukamurella tyrosinosolvens]SED06292.1 protein of unknown function [Tsukamurella tyrosinosolvens]VEH98001.1 Uncharacterised protein [Tsukamurella tyrosinosolvens]
MQRIFRAWLVVFGVVVIGIALAHFLFGQVTYIGGGEVNATMDSDLRVFNVLFAAYGAAFVWASRDVLGRAREINLLGLLFFVGAIGRVLAWITSGAPTPFYIAMLVVEFVVPVVHVAVLRALADGAPSDRTGATAAA